MSDQPLDLRKSLQLLRQHKFLVTIFVVLGLAAGVGLTVLHPAMLTRKIGPAKLTISFPAKRRIDVRENEEKQFIHSPLYSGFAPASDAVASVPPNPIVSTAEEGTITIDPRSLMASYSIFMARR